MGELLETQHAGVAGVAIDLEEDTFSLSDLPQESQSSDDVFSQDDESFSFYVPQQSASEKLACQNPHAEMHTSTPSRGDVLQNSWSFEQSKCSGHGDFEFDNPGIDSSDDLFYNGPNLPIHNSCGIQKSENKSSSVQIHPAIENSGSPGFFFGYPRNSSNGSQRSSYSWESGGRDSERSSSRSSSGNSRDSHFSDKDAGISSSEHHSQELVQDALKGKIKEREATATARRSRGKASFTWRVLSLQPLNPPHTRSIDVQRRGATRSSLFLEESTNCQTPKCLSSDELKQTKSKLSNPDVSGLCRPSKGEDAGKRSGRNEKSTGSPKARDSRLKPKKELNPKFSETPSGEENSRRRSFSGRLYFKECKSASEVASSIRVIKMNTQRTGQDAQSKKTHICYEKQLNGLSAADSVRRNKCASKVR